MNKNEKNIDMIISDGNELVVYNVENKKITLTFFDGHKQSSLSFFINEDGNIDTNLLVERIDGLSSIHAFLEQSEVEESNVVLALFWDVYMIGEGDDEPFYINKGACELLNSQWARIQKMAEDGDYLPMREFIKMKSDVPDAAIDELVNILSIPDEFDSGFGDEWLVSIGHEGTYSGYFDIRKSTRHEIHTFEKEQICFYP